MSPSTNSTKPLRRKQLLRLSGSLYFVGAVDVCVHSADSGDSALDRYKASLLGNAVAAAQVYLFLLSR